MNRGRFSPTGLSRSSVAAWQLCVRFWQDESGQDLIEYGLLTGIVGVSMVIAFGAISVKMGNAYNGWNTAAQNAWEPCAPASSGLPCP